MNSSDLVGLDRPERCEQRRMPTSGVIRVVRVEVPGDARMKPQFGSGEISGERQATRMQIVLCDSAARVDSASPNIPGNFGPLAPVFGLMFRCIGAALSKSLTIGFGKLVPIVPPGRSPWPRNGRSRT